MLVWAVIKIVHVEAILPGRTADRHVRETAARLAELVPPGETLYLDRLKDEGVLFYYARPARRFRDGAFPAGAGYAVFNEAEWRQLSDSGRFEAVEWLRDQQGGSFVLVRGTLP